MLFKLYRYYMHEYTPRHAVPIKGSTNRAFGLVFSVVFVLIALYPLLGSGTIRSWSLIVAGIFLLLALVIPGVLAPANRLWMKFGELMHRIVRSVYVPAQGTLGVHARPQEILADPHPRHDGHPRRPHRHGTG